METLIHDELSRDLYGIRYRMAFGGLHETLVNKDIQATYDSLQRIVESARHVLRTHQRAMDERYLEGNKPSQILLVTQTADMMRRIRTVEKTIETQANDLVKLLETTVQAAFLYADIERVKEIATL